MTWAEYYDKFYDWSESTQANRLSSLTDFGPSSEICEIAQDLCEDKLALRLIKKALAAGVRFQPDDITHGCEFGGNGGIKTKFDLHSDRLYWQGKHSLASASHFYIVILFR